MPSCKSFRGFFISLVFNNIDGIKNPMPGYDIT
jgi:hypothetical protein